MRIAVFTSQFPGRVNTFFARDMRELLDAGFEIDVFPLYPLDASMWRFVPSMLDASVLPRQRVHHLSIGALREARRRPAAAVVWRFLRDAGLVLGESVTFGPTVVGKSGYALMKAWLWATREAGGTFDHVLAYWGNYAATAAHAFQRLAAPRAPLSMVLHAGTDLYRQRVFFRHKLQHASRVFVVCDFNRRFLHEQYPDLYPSIAGKITLHHLGLDLDAFPCTVDRDADAEFIAVGSLEAAKGFDDLLRAAGRLKRRALPVRVRIVGVGPQAEALRALAREEGVEHLVRFDGWQTPDDVRTAIAQAQVLVHPSKGLGDAVPTVIKEAMALGTPVIATTVAGIPELLDDGRCGVLVAPEAPGDLARAIEGLRSDAARRRHLALAARRRAETLFDIRVTGARWASCLRETTCVARDARPH